jgi:hypothetical protein
MRRTTAFLVTLLASFAILAGTATASGGGAGATLGAGRFLYQGSLEVRFAFAAVSLPNGSAAGGFIQKYTLDGLTTIYTGRVTCVAFDDVNHRAWVGGVLTSVHSDDPSETHVAGDDAWFRVVDYGRDGATPDRSTVYGFKGAIPTSSEYCRLKIWAPDDARTWPVIAGEITVR